MNSKTSENLLMIHKPNCDNNDITTIRTSSESHIYWKKHFHKNSIYFRLFANFEAYNEIDNSSIGKTNQLKFINKTQYLMVMKKYLNWKTF